MLVVHFDSKPGAETLVKEYWYAGSRYASTGYRVWCYESIFKGDEGKGVCEMMFDCEV